MFIYTYVASRLRFTAFLTACLHFQTRDRASVSTVEWRDTADVQRSGFRVRRRLQTGVRSRPTSRRTAERIRRTRLIIALHLF